MEPGGYGSQVVNDNDGNPHISRKMPQQTDIGVETTG